jgi:hypothetical protein
MKNILMGLLLLAVAGTASAQGNSGRDRAAGEILGNGNGSYSQSNGTYNQGDRDRYDDRNRSDKDRYDKDRYDKDRYDNRNTSYNARDRYESSVRDLNRDYDARIASVQHDRRLRNAERRRTVASLERERQDRLRDLNSRYYASQRNDRNDGRGYANNGRY